MSSSGFSSGLAGTTGAAGLAAPVASRSAWALMVAAAPGAGAPPLPASSTCHATQAGLRLLYRSSPSEQSRTR